MIRLFGEIGPNWIVFMGERNRADIVLELDGARQSWANLKPLMPTLASSSETQVYRHLSTLLTHLSRILHASSEYVPLVSTWAEMLRNQKELEERWNKPFSHQAMEGSILLEHPSPELLQAFDRVTDALESNSAQQLVEAIARHLVPTWHHHLASLVRR